MATLYISEYSATSKESGNNPIQVAQEPALTDQAVTFTTATQSNKFADATKLVRVIADANCHIAFGTNPTATAGNKLLIANTVEYFGVDMLSGYKLSVYDGSS